MTVSVSNVSRYDSWACVHYAEPDELRDIEGLADEGYFIGQVSALAIPTIDALRDVLGDIFEFPDWCGDQPDSISDCLGDLEWLPAEGYILIVETDPDRAPSDGVRCLQQLWPWAAQWKAQQDQKPMHLVLVYRDDSEG